jgi:hypothetical protein
MALGGSVCMYLTACSLLCTFDYLSSTFIWCCQSTICGLTLFGRRRTATKGQSVLLYIRICLGCIDAAAFIIAHFSCRQYMSRHEAAVGTEANSKDRFFAVDLHVNPFWVGRPFYMSTLCLKSLRLVGPCLRRPFSIVSRAHSPGSVLLSSPPLSPPLPWTGKDRIAHAAGSFSTPRIRNQILVRTGLTCA